MRVTSSLVLAMALCSASIHAGETVTAAPPDHGKALVNPSMGWTMHFYSNILANYGSKLEPSDTLDDFPGLACIYLRLPWGFIEREEGKFDWSVVDAPAQRWIDKGLTVAFRFSCSESWLRYATPKWVQDAGAKGYDFTVGKGVTPGGPFWEPDYGDPVFLRKLEAFLTAAARRYDGNPNVAFIDVGSFGVWGEGHVFHSSRLKYAPEIVKAHLDLHARIFRKTLLAANDDFSFQDREKYEIMAHAFKLGMTLRDDSILVQPPPQMYFHADLAQQVWERLPVILENEHYGSSRDRKAWGDGEYLLRAVEEYHASYASIHWWPREFLEEQRGLIDRVNRRLGYRLQLRGASWPARAQVDGSVAFVATWANAGVAPCYPGGFPAWTFKDAKGGIVAVFVDEGFDVRTLQVGAPDAVPVRERSAAFRFAVNMTPGTYSVFCSVGTRDGTPVIALPHAGDDGKRRYKLGTIEVVRAAK